MSLIGTTLGRIRILEALGRGGMGEVFVGYDEKLERRVALKAISGRQRFDEEARARFLREARILSQLDHPGICRIHELIEGEEGDFLVLEFIEGITLRQAMKDDLDPAFKWLVVEKIAEALAVAHSKGIAHRDLKPENVMLTPDGGVKVLDFGLALYAEPRRDGAPTPSPGAAVAAPDAAPVDAAPVDAAPVDAAPVDVAPGDVATATGTVMGTLAYMSPEQARGERPTTAGDLYSLGLLVQELFTGRSAYRPGLKMPLLVLEAAAGETLDARAVEPRLDPDLAALLERLKSLVPAARPTAAETLERLRAIRAKPRRRLRRLALAAGLALLLLGGLKYTSDLRRERALAVEARREAEQVSEFLVDLFTVSEPQKARGNAVTARELLDQGARQVRAELRGQPRSQARLMVTMGRVYRQLGLYDEARPLLEEALEIRRRELGEEHLETAAALDQLASLCHDQGEYGRAEPYFLRALEIREKLLGEDHPHVAASLNNLAFLYRAMGDGERAAPLFRRALEVQRRVLGDEHPDVARSLNNLGELYREEGDLERAAPLLRRAVEIQERQLGADHPSLAASLNNLAMVHHERGEAAAAEPLYRRTLEISERVLGEEHPNVASILNNLAELYRQGGRFAAAEPLYLRALEIQERALGPSHPGLATSLGNLADLYAAMDDGERAEPLYRRALAIEEEAFAEAPQSLVITLVGLADLLARQGRRDEAEALYLRALEGARQEWRERPESRGARRRLAAARIGLGRLYEASGASGAAELEAGLELLAGLDGAARTLGDLHLEALALLELGRVEAARDDVERLLAKGWRHPEFLRLARAAGLEDDL